MIKGLFMLQRVACLIVFIIFLSFSYVLRSQASSAAGQPVSDIYQAFFAAVKDGDTALIRDILNEINLNINMNDPRDDKTALEKAVSTNNLPLVSELLCCNANITQHVVDEAVMIFEGFHITKDSDYDMLDEPAQEKLASIAYILRLLLVHNCPFDYSDNRHLNIIKQIIPEELMRASLCNDTKTLKKLLAEKGSPRFINQQDMHDMSALHFAAARGNTESVEILLNHNPSCDLKNQENKTAQHLAKQNNHGFIRDMIREYIITTKKTHLLHLVLPEE
jgi:ankyrin repeat protein